MNYNHSRKNNSTIAVQVMCAIVFILFSFVWLFCFQSELLAMSQHMLSNGVTRYNPVVGTVIIIVVLMIVQLVVYGFTRLNKRFHALTYVPSMFLLAVLTSCHLNSDGSLDYGINIWLSIFVILFWGIFVFFAKQYQTVEYNQSYSLFSRPMWINMLLMSLQIICLTSAANTNAVFHYRLKIEGLLQEAKYDKALKIGDESLESDADLQMVRMYALSREKALGEKLFQYPIVGTSGQMLPTNGQTKMLFYPVDSLYRYLGGKPSEAMEPMRYIELLVRRDSIVPKQVADYRLCGLLIDKDIDRFAREVGKFYSINKQLPRHYKEALTLYRHLRSTPVLEYHDPVTDENWRNMQELEKKYPNFMERKGKVSELYGTTYWYYYNYCK